MLAPAVLCHKEPAPASKDPTGLLLQCFRQKWILWVISFQRADLSWFFMASHKNTLKIFRHYDTLDQWERSLDYPGPMRADLWGRKTAVPARRTGLSTVRRRLKPSWAATSWSQGSPPPCRGLLRGVATPVIWCHKEPMGLSGLPYAGSLWQKDS